MIKKCTFATKSTLYRYPLFDRAEHFGTKSAVLSPDCTKEYSYADLSKASDNIASLICRSKVDIEFISYYSLPGFEHSAIQWGIWKSGACAIPLCVTHPPSEIEYVVRDSNTRLILTSDEKSVDMIKNVAFNTNAKVLWIGKEEMLDDSHNLVEHRVGRIHDKALVIYTSGTTSRPKGVVLSHLALQTQMSTLSSAWKWSSSDTILNALPLHHVHGAINATLCAFWSGATVCFQKRFDAASVWNLFNTKRFSLWMAVPTMYSKLIDSYHKLPGDQQRICSESCDSFRLMVSGSMALPESIKKEWKSISNHNLLERYGMTEIGMALSHDYDGERSSGSVGKPLPGVQTKIINQDENGVGEICVKGQMLFSEYLNKPMETENSFDSEGYFKTGDMVQILPNGDYQIVGRASVDILKSAGYKISALDVERCLLDHEQIKEISVIGVPDEEYGQIVTAVLVLKYSEPALSVEVLREWCLPRMAQYKIPRNIWIINEIPRNAMGKVNKKDLLLLYVEATK